MRLRYTVTALAELDQVLADIAVQSPQGADRVQRRIQSIINLLMEYPHSGQLTSLPPLRRIVATPYPYLIFYEPAAGEIVIIGVRHGARDPSSMPGIL